MKLWFGLLGAPMLTAIQASVVVKVREPTISIVVLVGVIMTVVDLWQARDEPDSWGGRYSKWGAMSTPCRHRL